MEVICTSCNQSIYHFAGDIHDTRRSFGVEDIRALNGGSAPRASMLCPKCGMKFYQSSLEGDTCLLLGNGRWWPHPPLT